MTENNSLPENSESQPGKIDPANEPQSAVPPKKKKRRWILKTLVALVVLIVLLVLLAPTLISMGMVREMVVSQINSSALNGKLQIKDWSFGWTSGVHIEGVQLDDPDNVHLLSVAEISTPVSFLKAATGNIDLGDVTIKGVDFNARLDSNGELNFNKAIKPGSPKQPSNTPSKLPNIKGTIHIEDVTGTFQDDVDHVMVGLPQQSPLNVTVAIKDINQPIADSVDLGLQLDERNLIKIKVDGTVAAIQNNLVDTNKLTANQTIELSEGDLAAVSQALHAMHLNLDVSGRMNGKITATVNSLNNISADVGIDVADLSAGGKQLSGDTVAFQSCHVGVKAAVTSTGGNNAQISFDMPIVIQPKGGAKADEITVHADLPQDSLMGTANVFKAIAARLAKNPGETSETASIPGAGDINISANFNVANLVSQLPGSLHLEKGTSLTSGVLTHETTITLGGGKAVIASETHLKDFAGTSNGQPVRVNDIDATAGLTAVGGDHPDLRDLNVGLNSAFAQVKGGGATLGKLNIQGTSDLSNVQKQVGQVVDLDALMQAPAGSHVSLSGTLAFDVHTDGDLTADESEIGVGADFSATGVNINIPGRRTINEPKLSATIAANLHHAASQFVEAVHDLKIGVQSPAINFAAAGDVKVGGKFGVEIPSFKISQGSVDLRLAQEEFGGAMSLFVPKPGANQTPTLAQRLADNSIRVASGSVNISGEVKLDQTGFGFPAPLQIQIQPTDLTVVDDMGTAQTAHVPAVSIAISGNGAVNDQNVATVKNLTLSTVMGPASAPLFDLEISADAAVPMAGGSTVSVSRLELTRCDGDLPNLQTALGPLLPMVAPAPPAVPGQNAPPSMLQLVAQNVLVCTSGKLSGSMLASFDGTTLAIKQPLTLTIANLTLQQRGAGANSTPINDQTVRTTIGGSASLADGISLQDVNVGVDTSFAEKLNISQGQIVLAKRVGNAVVPVGPLDMLQSANVEVDNVDLVKVDAVVNQLFNQAAAPAPGETVVVVVPPPQVTSGTATLKLDISRSGNTTTANISQVLVHGLALKSGGNTTTWPSDITAKLSAVLETREGATADMPVMDQLSKASVTALSVDSGIGTTVGLTDQKPIVASNFGDPANMLVQGGINIDGDIAPAARIAETFGGAQPNSYPYQGHFHFDESVVKAGGQPRLQIRGGGTITKFVVMGQPGPNGAAAQPVFSEDDISVKNPLDFDFNTFSVIIDKTNPIAIVLNSTGAAGVSISGTINDVVLKRQIADGNPVLVQLSYDLAKLWTIAKPLLSPSQQQTFADLAISGKEARDISVSGSFPADKPFGQAVAMLRAGGYLTVDSLSTQGITLTNFDIPFTLRGGVLRTVYPDQPESSNAPRPATCNGGTLNIGVFRVDLKSDPMLVSLPRVNGGAPLAILNNVSINPAMSKSILGKVLNNPAFVNANQAQGLVTVSILHLDKMPLSGLLTQASPDNQGTAEVQYSVRGLVLGSPLLAVFGNASMSADINNADVKVAGGNVTEDTTMMIDGNKPLRFAGVVVLATEQFAPMTAYIPPALFARLIPAQDRQFVPDQIILPMKGDMSNPKLELDKAIAQTIQQGAKKAAVNGLLQGLQHIH